jgi:hypothetical protein
MMQVLAIAISTALAALALVHAYWGAGGYWPAATAHDLALTVVGAPGIRRMPPPTSCFAVAVVLMAVAIWPLGASGVIPLRLAPRLMQLAGAGIILVFLLRGIAPYFSAWRRIWPEQPFARLDRHVYGPLCLALGTGCLILLFAGPHP